VVDTRTRRRSGGIGGRIQGVHQPVQDDLLQMPDPLMGCRLSFSSKSSSTSRRSCIGLDQLDRTGKFTQLN
jgi:hypothetical protein